MDSDLEKSSQSVLWVIRLVLAGIGEGNEWFPSRADARTLRPQYWLRGFSFILTSPNKSVHLSAQYYYTTNTYSQA